jgi:glyoxalase/bleomycin resistance protein/dioxygenase superfamily protein
VLHHVSLEVPPEGADRFGELLGLLGFAATPAPAVLGDSVRWFERDGTQIHLIVTEAATIPVLGHVAVVPDDFAGSLERLSAAGFEVMEARELWGERRAFVTGPGEHRIELMAAPPR